MDVGDVIRDILKLIAEIEGNELPFGGMKWVKSISGEVNINSHSVGYVINIVIEDIDEATYKILNIAEKYEPFSSARRLLEYIVKETVQDVMYFYRTGKYRYLEGTGGGGEEEINVFGLIGVGEPPPIESMKFSVDFSISKAGDIKLRLVFKCEAIEEDGWGETAKVPMSLIVDVKTRWWYYMHTKMEVEFIKNGDKIGSIFKECGAEGDERYSEVLDKLKQKVMSDLSDLDKIMFDFFALGGGDIRPLDIVVLRFVGSVPRIMSAIGEDVLDMLYRIETLRKLYP